MLLGKLGDLQIPDAIIVDEAGFHQMWPGEPLHTGKVIEMNDRRAVVVGVFRASQTFMTHADHLHALQPGDPVRAARPAGMMPFVLAKASRASTPRRWPAASRRRPGLKALTKRRVHPADHELLPEPHRHPAQLRHHRVAGLPGRLRHRRADVLPVHGREPQAVRHAQGDGHERPARSSA